jgi:hypothetical protein
LLLFPQWKASSSRVQFTEMCNLNVENQKMAWLLQLLDFLLNRKFARICLFSQFLKMHSQTSCHSARSCHFAQAQGSCVIFAGMPKRSKWKSLTEQLDLRFGGTR